MPSAIKKAFKGKTALVTGGTGAIGSELVRQLLRLGAAQVRVLSRDDTKQHNLLETLRYPKKLRLFVGDIRDRERLDLAFRGVDVVFHAAALKHVPLCEYNPFEAVKTNVIGSQNVVDMALKNNVNKVIAVSTDKAVHPESVMGASKLMMEKLFVNANYYKGRARTVFSCVRFGNVAWARGSVLPSWDRQAAEGRTIRVTDHGMTRFFMSIDQAVRLVLEASVLARGGEIFILKMPSIRLGDLAALFVKKYHTGKKVKIKVIGNRGGEKMHEELLDQADRRKHVFENQKMFVVVADPEVYNWEGRLASYRGFKKAAQVGRYSSQDALDAARVSEMI